MDCYSLSNDPTCLKSGGPLNSSHDNKLFNYFLKNDVSFFGDNNFNSKNEQDIKVFKTILSESSQSTIGFSEIESINDSSVSENETFWVEKPLVVINGWSLDENEKELDSIYLIVNDEPFLKFDEFYPRNDIAKNLGIDMDLNSGWSISFLSGYLEETCQLVTLVGLKDDKKIELKNQIELCKN